MNNHVFAIDPGPTHSAWVLWDGSQVLAAEFAENFAVRLELFDRFQNTQARYACEMIASYGMAVGASVFETCVQIGRFEEICGGSLERVLRQEVKLHLCQSPRAKDANIRQALLDRFGPVGTKRNPGPLFGISSHKWAALAVAVTFYDKEILKNAA